MAPAFGGEGLRGNRTHVATRLDPHTAARRHRRNPFAGARDRRRFVGIAGELGDGAERTDTPRGFDIVQPIGEKIQETLARSSQGTSSC